MTTKTAGGRINSRMGLTFEATVALEIGDKVEVSNDYTVIKATGTKPVIGRVTVANKTRVAGAFPVNQVPGDVTVDVRGSMVSKETAFGALTAGTEVGFDADGRVKAAGAGVATVGVALMTVTTQGDAIDILWY